MEETTIDIQPPAGSPTHPEPSRRSLKKQIVISLLCTSALVAAFATGRMTGSTTSVDSAQDSLTNVGLRNQENSIQIRGSLPEELSEIWAAIDGLRTDTGTQNAAITNQLNQETADRQAALTQLNASLQTTFTNLEDLTTTTAMFLTLNPHCTAANLSADLQQEISDRQQAVASATSTLQSSIDGLSSSFNADLATETAERDSADANLENILACRPGLIRDPNDSTKCIPCGENQFWSARTGGCSDCPAHSTATAGSTSCTCDSGYAEAADGCQDVDECLDNLCGDNAACTNTDGSFTCQCDEGFVLEQGVCQVAPSCPFNSISTDEGCVQCGTDTYASTTECVACTNPPTSSVTFGPESFSKPNVLNNGGVASHFMGLKNENYQAAVDANGQYGCPVNAGTGEDANFCHPMSLPVVFDPRDSSHFVLATANQVFSGVIDSNGVPTTTLLARQLSGFVFGAIFDNEGNLIVSHYGAGTIEKLAPYPSACDFTVIAGTNVPGGVHQRSSVDGMGTDAIFKAPKDIAIDRQTGDIYIADHYGGLPGGSCLRKMAPDGMVTTLAGQCGGNSQIIDGTGTSAAFERVDSLSVTADGTIYLADGAKVRAVTRAGEVTTLPISVPGIRGVGLVADDLGNLIVSSRIDDYNGDGKIYRYANGELSVLSDSPLNHSPKRLDIGPDGSVYVLDDQRTHPNVGFVQLTHVTRIQ